jgi:hypothetical protein
MVSDKVAERSKKNEKCLKETNQPLPPLLDAKRVPIPEKIIDLWVGPKASAKVMKNECGKIFAAEREKEKKRLSARADRMNDSNLDGSQNARQNSATTLFVAKKV